MAPLCLTASISTVLAHPLLLLIVGAAVSSYLVPSLTRSWQDHQKELEVKVSLVDQISKTVAEFIIAVQLAAFRSDIQTQEEFDEAYKDWEVAKPTIIGRLRAYFPNSPLLDEWKELALGVTDLYRTIGASETERARQLRQLADGPGESDASITDLWREAKMLLLEEADLLGAHVFGEKIPQFNRPALLFRGKARVSGNEPNV